MHGGGLPGGVVQAQALAAGAADDAADEHGEAAATDCGLWRHHVLRDTPVLHGILRSVDKFNYDSDLNSYLDEIREDPNLDFVISNKVFVWFAKTLNIKFAVVK